MSEILKLADSFWNEEMDTYSHHPMSPPFGMVNLAEGFWFYKEFANTIFAETQDGLIMIDPAWFRTGQSNFESIRAVTSQRLNTAIFTHGHVDHCFGVSYYEEEAKAKGWEKPVVIAHEAMPARFDRYRELRGYNGIINSRQFQGGAQAINFPVDFRYPDTLYHDRLTIQVGGVEAMLRHAAGETDDHTWVFFPDQRILATGDLFIWCMPNCGNPQKVQRYAKTWATALREMAALKPEILAPGHGWPIVGSDRVQEALTETARLLESLHNQTIELMNKGASLDTIIHTINAPEGLLQKPYLHPVYDEPEFIVRNTWRLYGGWYDGTPSHLKPAPERAQAMELARLAGGVNKLAAKAEELSENGDFRLACHFADWAYLAAPEDSRLSQAMGEIYAARAKSETSTMVIGIFLARAREMKGKKPKKDVIGGEVIRKVFETQEKKSRNDHL